MDQISGAFKLNPWFCYQDQAVLNLAQFEYQKKKVHLLPLLLEINKKYCDQIGSRTGSTTIDQQEISTSGKNLIKRMSNGEVHIENSLITKENNGKQELYAKDTSGSPIPINITNGSKLLINGRDVEQSINNVGIKCSKTGLPTVSIDSKLSCGIGTGAHGGNVAFAGGCASKVNHYLAFNAYFSYSRQYQGDFEDSYSVRAGFIFKIGKDDKTNLIRTCDLAVLKSDNEKLKESNITIFSLHKEP